jgi:hypothetical protein
VICGEGSSIGRLRLKVVAGSWIYGVALISLYPFTIGVCSTFLSTESPRFYAIRSLRSNSYCYLFLSNGFLKSPFKADELVKSFI